MACQNTFQTDAQKSRSSLAVEGERPEDGLAAFGDDGNDGDHQIKGLARKLMFGKQEADSVESALDRAWRVPAAHAEQLLVDDE